MVSVKMGQLYFSLYNLMCVIAIFLTSNYRSNTCAGYNYSIMRIAHVDLFVPYSAIARDPVCIKSSSATYDNYCISAILYYFSDNYLHKICYFTDKQMKHKL